MAELGRRDMLAMVLLVPMAAVSVHQPARLAVHSEMERCEQPGSTYAEYRPTGKLFYTRNSRRISRQRWVTEARRQSWYSDQREWVDAIERKIRG